MQRKANSGIRLSVVRVTIQAADWQDSGIGIVVARHPLTLLVPSHLIELVEQGQSHDIHVNGVPYEHAKILPTPALQRDYLSVLHFPKKHHRDLLSAHLPRRSVQLSPGQSISLQRLPSESSASGTVIDVREQGDGCSIITDIPVSIGDSGSPLLVSGELAAICQGMIQHEGAGNAVAVPLSQDSLAELKNVSRRYRISILGTLIGAFLAVILSFAGFAIYSANSFTLAGIEVAEDGSTVTATNAQAVTVNSSWTRSFDTSIRRFQMFASHVGSPTDRIAIGTVYEDDIDGAISVLNAKGSVLWSYSVPEGECIYSTPELTYDGYLVDVIKVADLNEDGLNELLVVFVHDHFFPSKLVVFSMAGSILAEYWHPGYIRTISAGPVGESEDILVVMSASNNTIATDWWNPQTLFAFHGLDIAGQGPTHDSAGEGGKAGPSGGDELWYRVIVNVDPESVRAKCYELNIIDFNGDGLNEIQVSLTDGRFFYLNEFGVSLDVHLGDRFLQLFPDTPPPPLVDIDDYLQTD